MRASLMRDYSERSRILSRGAYPVNAFDAYPLMVVLLDWGLKKRKAKCGECRLPC